MWPVGMLRFIRLMVLPPGAEAPFYPAGATSSPAGSFCPRGELMPCDGCKHRGCREMGEFSRRWLLGRYVRDQEVECIDYEPRWCRGVEGVAA